MGPGTGAEAMTRPELLETIRLAFTGTLPRDYDDDGKPTDHFQNWAHVFDGAALHANRIMATKLQTASFIKYQAMQFNGYPDAVALEEVTAICRRVDLIA